jgi:OOP family OmpA-OmpF porin
MKLLPKLLWTAMAATIFSPAFAASQDSINQGYLVDSSGQIVTSNSGLCWHDADWTPARAVERCDPSLRPRAVAEPVVVVAVLAPAPVVLAPLPVPVPVPVPQKMSFSGDALFGFDKAVLRPEGQLMLSNLAQQLNATTFDTIVLSGHADRLGSEKYNQKLSEQRANAVKDFLITKDIAANRIEASGKGKSQPVTATAECLGSQSPRVIACLQPDRRVDVEVNAIKATAMAR